MYGEAQLNKECAVQIRDHALNAVAELSRALRIGQSNCNAEELERLKFACGNIIGYIEKDVLSGIYAQYPDLDDLQ